jgi:5-oxoprolinase (ATP-hydrolysing) subunit B
MTSFEIFELGDHALVATALDAVSFETQQRIWRIADLARGWPEVDEAIPGMNNVTLVFDPLSTGLDTLRTKLERVCEPFGGAADTEAMLGTLPDVPGRLVEIPVHYGGADGPDIDAVARHTGLSVEALIERHSAAEYTVYFLGFQPGFAYLGGLDPALAAPRRNEPRVRVPAGSVGIGGEQTGVYPTASPGGWQLIGRTSAVLFDPNRNPPSLLEPGDRVRFVPAGGER